MSSTSTLFRIVIVLCLTLDLGDLATKKNINIEDCTLQAPNCTYSVDNTFYTCNIFNPNDNITIFRTLQSQPAWRPLQDIKLRDKNFAMYWNTESIVLQVSPHTYSIHK